MPGIDEYYVIRITGKKVSAIIPVLSAPEIFIGDKNKPVPIDQAQKFVSINDCEHYLQQQSDFSQKNVHIQLCTSLNPDNSEHSQITALLMEIPYPYRRTAYNWFRGKDVETQLRSENDEVYHRHHKLLLQFDIDIAKPSTVLLLSARKKSSLKPYHDHLPDNAPKQFICTASLRPSQKSD